MKDKEKELTAVIETVLRETKNCDMSIETLTDYLVDRIKNKVIIEDSVVLSREEYEKLKYTWITDSDAYKKGCKEMAEKIFKMLISELESNQFLSGKRIIMEVDVENLAKKFDVEIE